MMNDEDWPKIEAILQKILTVPPDKRAAALAALTHETPEILAEVQAFLNAETAGEALLGEPLFGPSFGKVEAPAALTNARIGAYAIQSELGVGGMGRVYLAKRADDAYQALVAVKILKRGMDSDEIVRRFHNERQILAALNHPHIARLLDGGTTETGEPYLVMEYVQGLPLHQFTQQNASLTLNLQLFQKICQAVHYAHQHSVIHRDLKPSNILVTPEGEPKLLDFGIAKILDPGSFSLSEAYTETHVRLLTPKYASPEQFRRDPISTLTDVYNLGTLLYLIVTGSHPHWDESLSETELQHRVCQEEPVPPSVRVKQLADPNARGSRWSWVFSKSSAVPVSADLDRIILKAMHLEPSRRYESALAISHELERFLAGRPIAARGDSTGYVFAKLISRQRKNIFVGSLFLVVSMIFLFLFTAQKRDAHRERELAQVAKQRGNDLLDFTLGILDGIDPTQDRRELATLAELANVTAAQMETQALSDWHSRAMLLEKLAHIYVNLGAYHKAYLLAEKAFNLRIKNQDPDHLDHARTLLLMGRISQKKSGQTISTGLFEEALDIAKKTYGDGHFELAPYLSGLAASKNTRYFKKKALLLSQEAVTLYAKADAPNLSIQADILQTHGEILRANAHFSDAETYLFRSLELWRQHEKGSTRHGLNHFSLGELYRQWNYPSKAIFHYQLANDIVTQKLGPDHVTVGNILGHLGNLHLLLFEFPQAEHHLLQAIAILDKGETFNRTRLPAFSYQLSNTYVNWGKYVQAANYAELARAQFSTIYNHLNPSWVLPLYNLAGLAYKHQDLELAAQYNNQAYAVLEKTYGLKHRLAIPILGLRSKILAETDQPEEALDLSNKTLARARSSFKKDPQFLANALGNAGSVAETLGEKTRAIAHYAEARRLLEDEFGAHDPLLVDPLLDLAKFMHAEKRPQEAMHHLARALGIMQCFMGPESEKVSDAFTLYHELNQQLLP